MQASEMNPKLLLEIIRRHKRIFLVSAGTIILATLIIAVALPPVYKSTATILIEQQDIPEDYVRTTITTYAEQQLQIINQRVMTATRLLEIINCYNLYSDLKDRKTAEEIVERMRDDIKLSPISVDVVDRRTGRPTTATIAFTLAYSGKNNPLKVQQIANVLTSLFLEENVKIREQQASEISKFLTSEMQKVKDDLAAVDKRLTDFKNAHMNELPEMMNLNLQTLNNLERDNDQLKERLRYLKQREEYLRTQLGTTSPSQRQLDREKIEELRLQLITLRNLYSDQYPDVETIKKEISKLEKKLNEPDALEGSRSWRPDNPAYVSLSSELSGVASEKTSVQSQMADLNARIRDYQARVAGSPRYEAEYTSLMGQKNNTQAKLDDLMRKIMEARVSQGLEEGQKGERFTLIEPARLPEKPFRPNRLLILIAGTVFGIGAGIAAMLLKEMTDTSLYRLDDISGISPEPVLAAIPNILTNEDISRIRRRRIILAGCITAGITAALALFHFLVMNLDLMWVLMLKRMGW